MSDSFFDMFNNSDSGALFLLLFLYQNISELVSFLSYKQSNTKICAAFMKHFLWVVPVVVIEMLLTFGGKV